MIAACGLNLAFALVFVRAAPAPRQWVEVLPRSHSPCSSWECKCIIKQVCIQPAFVEAQARQRKASTTISPNSTTPVCNWAVPCRRASQHRFRAGLWPRYWFDRSGGMSYSK
jgi:hypothetical protein